VNAFIRDDGRPLAVVPGFRRRVLAARSSVTPRPDWTAARFADAAAKRRRRFQRIVQAFSRWGGCMEQAKILDVGCGDGMNCLLLATQPVREVVGIDLELPLLTGDERGQLTTALAGDVLDLEGPEELRRALSGWPVRFARMDAKRLAFKEGSFDLVLSRSALEHIQPPEQALHEMARVVRSGGLVYLAIDPFFWLRGCHKRGLVDIPWAHARLSVGEFHRFVTTTEGPATAARRNRRLETLNRLTLQQWRERITAGAWELLEWKQRFSELGQIVLKEQPGVEHTLLPGVTRDDLLHERIEVWLRKR
jgi:ubiquinone/menaquinone biosynthesis C-methylase UbiE